MEKQDRFLDKSYLETRIREFDEIKNGELCFKIKNSDRAKSKTLYVLFYCESLGSWYKNHTLRISDHFLPNYIQTQFLIDIDKPMTKKKKDEFIYQVNASIRKAKTRRFCKTLEKVSKRVKGTQ